MSQYIDYDVNNNDTHNVDIGIDNDYDDNDAKCTQC